jgi:plasmid maintenance system antidote protein VapI
LKISPGLLSDIIRGKNGISVEFDLRFERCLGLAADWLLRTQAHYDYCTAYHGKIPVIRKEVQSLVRNRWPPKKIHEK